MTIERKSCAPQIKAVSAGQATVVIATLNVRDKDGDVIIPGFFGEQIVPVVGAHDWGSIPIGKARVYEQGSEALADITFNRDTTDGADWHAAIKFDFDHPPARQEYSFGFRVLEGGQDMGEFAGERARFLKPLPNGSPGADVAEVSPVLRGAGQRTRTLAIKAEGEPPAQTEPTPDPPDAKRLTIDQLLTLMKSQIDHLGFIQEMRSADGKQLSDATIILIDEVSVGFDALRAQVKLGPIMRPPVDAEIGETYQALSTELSRIEEVEAAHKAAETEDLYRRFVETSEQVNTLLER